MDARKKEISGFVPYVGRPIRVPRETPAYPAREEDITIPFKNGLPMSRPVSSLKLRA
jgi:hypothetical protein